MSLQYSRGCPFNCEFCDIVVLFGRKPRVKTADQVVRELQSLYDSGWRSGVFFVDDNLIGNKRHLKAEVLPAILHWQEERKFPFSLSTEVSINLADDDELMKSMADAGFFQVFVGVETPNAESLAECDKSQNENRDMVAAVKKMQAAGLQVQGGFIVGFDSDPLSIFKAQVAFIQKSGIVTAMVGMLQAVPGTKLFRRLEGEGRLLGKGSGDNVDGTTNIVPRMGLEKLRAGYLNILRHIYTPKHYYRRLRTFLREYRPPKAKARPRFAQLMAFARSTFHLGVIGRERFEYWKLLLWTSFRRPRLLPLAVTLAACGHHFRRIAELRAG
jgi:radical SAM superfamily enzyme YgiQ (UPF0313 family)